jgi:hypothetical protein
MHLADVTACAKMPRNAESSQRRDSEVSQFEMENRLVLGGTVFEPVTADMLQPDSDLFLMEPDETTRHDEANNRPTRKGYQESETDRDRLDRKEENDESESQNDSTDFVHVHAVDQFIVGVNTDPQAEKGIK